MPHPHISLVPCLVDSLEFDELAVAELEVAALHGGNAWDTSAAFTGGGQRRCDARRIGAARTCSGQEVWLAVARS
jgi:hypothetical protein